MKTFKSVVAIAMSVLTMASTTACSETDVLTAAVIIGAAVVAPVDHRPIGRGDYHRDRRHRRDHRDHRGRRDDRRGGHYGSRNLYALQSADTTPAAFVSSDARVVKIAEKYEITDYAATFIARAIILAEQKDLTGVTELGLSKKDLQKVYQGKELKTSKLEALSEKLILSRSETQRLITEMTEDIQIEKAARGI